MKKNIAVLLAVCVLTSIFPICQQEAQSEGMQTITIVEPSSLIDVFIDDILMDCPNLDVKISQVEIDELFSLVTTENLSQNSDIDLFLLYDNSIGPQDIFQRGFAAPITSKELQANISQMYPKIGEYLSCDGQLMAYPESIMMNCFTCNTELLEKSGIGAVPTTFEEYLDCMIAWVEKYGADEPGFSLNACRDGQLVLDNAVWEIVCEYLKQNAFDDEPVSFQSPVFSHLMEKAKQLYQMMKELPKPTDEERWSSQYVFNCNATVPTFYGDAANQYFPCLTIDKESGPRMAAGMTYFVVNPKTKNMDAVMEFLESYERQRAAVFTYLFYPDRTDYPDDLQTASVIQDAENTIALYQGNIASAQNRIADLEKTIQENQAAGLSPEEYPNLPMAIDREKQVIAELEDKIAEEEAIIQENIPYRYEVNEAGLIVWRNELAPYLVFDRSTIGWVYSENVGILGILQKYFEGSISLDQALTQLDRKMEMLYYETH